MTDSLQIAREKIGRLLEIYAPMTAGRDNAMAAMQASLIEFEVAVREDERQKVLAELTAPAVSSVMDVPDFLRNHQPSHDEAVALFNTPISPPEAQLDPPVPPMPVVPSSLEGFGNKGKSKHK